MQLIDPNFSWKNWIKQTKVNQEKLSQFCIFYPVAEDLDPSNRIQMHQFGVFTNIFHITEWIFFV